jgi:hypothetical protein
MTSPVSYQWSSTNTEFFAYNSTAMFNKKRLLSAADAGLHTCTVTDDHGSMGQANLDMAFEGLVLYVVSSDNAKEEIVANNSLVFRYPPTCSGCSVEFYCFSNSTISGVGEVVFPDGTTRNSDHFVERLPFSTLRVQVPNNSASGLHTCSMPDSNGNILEASIGLYSRSIIGPAINILLSGYSDLTKDDQTAALARVECYTTGSPPTTVIWKRDGAVIDAKSSRYDTLQIATDRRHSHFRNILLINDVFDVVGNYTFTCEIENSAGSTSHSTTINIPVTPKARVEASPHSGREGEEVTLACEGTAGPLKTSTQLAPHITVEWVGPTGAALTKENSITLGAQRLSPHGGVRTLTFNGTTFRHAGVYSCLVSLNGADSVLKQESVAKYHLTLQKKHHCVWLGKCSGGGTQYRGSSGMHLEWITSPRNGVAVSGRQHSLTPDSPQ